MLCGQLPIHDKITKYNEHGSSNDPIVHLTQWNKHSGICAGRAESYEHRYISRNLCKQPRQQTDPSKWPAKFIQMKTVWCIHRELESKLVARIFWRGWTKREELLTILSITIGGGPSTNPTVSGGVVARPADVGGTFRQRPGYKHGWCVCGDERCVVSRRGDISRSGWAGTRGLYEKIKNTNTCSETCCCSIGTHFT